MNAPTETLRQFHLYTETGTTVFSYNPANRTWSVDLGCYSGPSQDLADKLRRTADQLETLAESLKPPRESLFPQV